LEPYDLAASKLVAYREKAQEFAAALIAASLVVPRILHDRISRAGLRQAHMRILARRRG
jgi:hypothetical protein